MFFPLLLLLLLARARASIVLRTYNIFIRRISFFFNNKKKFFSLARAIFARRFLLITRDAAAAAATRRAAVRYARNTRHDGVHNRHRRRKRNWSSSPFMREREKRMRRVKNALVRNVVARASHVVCIRTRPVAAGYASFCDLVVSACKHSTRGWDTSIFRVQ